MINYICLYMCEISNCPTSKQELSIVLLVAIRIIRKEKKKVKSKVQQHTALCAVRSASLLTADLAETHKKLSGISARCESKTVFLICYPMSQFFCSFVISSS